jgi:hypothetical protein
MKKQIIIFLLLSIQAAAQNPSFPVVKISVPCTDEFIDKYKGKWLIPNLDRSVNDYHGEVTKRLNQIQNLVYQTYRQPVGCDAVWSGGFAKGSFADEVKFQLVRKDEWEQQAVKTNPVYHYKYNLALCGWICHGTNEIMNSYPESGGGAIEIFANRLIILNGGFLEGNEWTIDGRRIQQKMPTIGKWKGYDVVATNGGIYADQNSEHFVLITRDGMLPYIPVTRKQYLDRAIQYWTRFYDDLNKKIQENNDALPAQVRTSQQEIDNQKANNTKAKNDALEKFHDELEKTTKDDLLDAPAVIRLDPMLYSEGPVFLPEAEGGCLLATENPNYFRKDLPKYVPQFFVFGLTWTTKGWSMQFKRTIEENFPIEKLQAMIDK